QGTNTLTFNGTTATPTSWSDTTIVAPVPSGATTGNVLVTVAGQGSNGSKFIVTNLPTITSISPGSGQAGSSVSILGANFGGSPGTGTVTFGGVYLPNGLGWHSISNTQLQTSHGVNANPAVCPPDNFNNSGYGFSDNCSNVYIAWNGGAWDEASERL